MKILLINGSPRKNGNVATMLRAMQTEAEEKGHKTTLLHISDLCVRPCTGCMACRTRGRCSLAEDDAQRTLCRINGADAFVVGAPCYWGNMPGQLKILFDRIVYGLMADNPRGFPRPLQRGKRAAVVTTCTTPYPFNIIFNQSRGTVRAIKEILRYGGFKIVGTVQKAGTRQRPSLADKELARCRKLCQRLLHAQPQ